MIPLLLLLAGLVYLAVMIISVRRSSLFQLAWLPAASAISLAGLAAISMVLYFYHFPQWQQPVEIAWTGLHSVSSNGMLQIGGEKQNAIIGWPTSAYWPQVSISSQDGTAAELATKGGSGFVKDSHGNYLNGTVLRLDEPVTYKDFSVTLIRHLYLGRSLMISSHGGPIDTLLVTDFTDGLLHRHPDRVIPLDQGLTETAVDLRSRHDAATAAKLEDWAAGMRLLASQKGDYRLLEPDAGESKASLDLPGSFTVLWPTRAVKVDLSRKSAETGLAVEFAPPWRMSSPLPPGTAQDPDDRTLTLTSHVLPGDRAFVLPFGEQLLDFRADLRMNNSITEGCAAVPANEIDRYVQQPHAPAGPWKGVTCEQSLRAGPYDLDFKAVRDVPGLGRIIVCFAVALLCFFLSLRQCVGRMWTRDRWALAGLALSIWLLLLFRCHLALRFALDPRFLDPLAVQGVTYAMILLAVGPAVISLAAPLWHDQYLSDTEKISAAKKIVINGLLLGVAVFVEAYMVSLFWPNLPKFYYPIYTWSGKALILGSVGGGLLMLLLFIAAQYLPRSSSPSPSRKPFTLRVLLFLQEFTTRSVALFHRMATEIGPDFWRSIEGPVRAPAWFRKIFLRSKLQLRDDDGHFYKKFFLLAGGTILLLVGIWGALSLNWLGTQKLFQEILIPLLICWLPSCLLLSSRKAFPPGSRQKVNWWRCSLIVATILLISVLLFRWAVHDVGGVVAALSVFIPVALLLLLGGRPWSIQLIPTGMLVLAMLLAIFFYVNFEATLGILKWANAETAGSRILAWKEGPNSQKLLALAGMNKKMAAPVAVTRRHLADAIEHTQENILMSHEGSYLGMRYGNAPTRRSQVRQDTLQYDSAFSFFVLSENGWVGGMALLLLYFLPLVFVWINGRDLFDVGHGMAAVVTGSFLLSAIIHAAMNWGNLPFTGRNLPLLSVNSLSDAILWTFLLGLAVQAMMWRVTDIEEFRADPDSIMMANDGPPNQRRFWLKGIAMLIVPAAFLAWSGITGIFIVRNDALKQGFEWRGLLEAVDSKISRGELKFDKDSLTIGPDMSLNTLLGQEIARFNALSEDEKLEGTRARGVSTFRQRLRQVRSIGEYDSLMTQLHAELADTAASKRPVLFEVAAPDDWADLDATIPAVDSDYHLRANPAYNTRVQFHIGDGQGDFPQVSLRASVAGTYSVHGPNYEFLIADHPADPHQDREVILTRRGSTLAVADQGSPTAAKARVILRFQPDRKAASINHALGDFEVRKDGLYFRPDRIKLRMHGKAGTTPAPPAGMWRKLVPGDVVETADFLGKDFRPQMIVSHSARGALIGPAWLNGDWMLAYDPDPFLPWTRLLTDAIWSAWSDPKNHDVATRLTSLSLDAGLQRAAQNFVGEKAREWHAELLRLHGSRQALPPRAALAIVDLPSGETLALGGWPRMNSGTHWLSTPAGDVIPDEKWLEDHAPKSIRQRYAGDRNFDRLLMGSSTKPLWAAAVLAIHKRLDRLLAVTGPGGKEEEVFGIPVTPGWTITHNSSSLQNSPWCDFTSYLAKSDNRYHIRIGFLGLTEPGPGETIQSGPGSDSPYESLNGGQSAWRHQPLFPAEIEFSGNNPHSMKGLHLLPLASNLTTMFGAGVESGDIRPRRYSFWTGDEADDWSKTAKPSFATSLFFAPISPEAPQLALDRIDHPRKYISLLLGGGENRWANVDFAGAFATAVQGYPVTVHITRETPVKSERVEFAEISRLLRPGLEAVVKNRGGTAYGPFTVTGALAFLSSLPPGTEVYAKTGTLGEASGVPTTSRLVLAIVRWNGNGKIERGLVFSLVIERGEQGLASRWLGEFLTAHEQEVRSYLASRP